MRVFDPEAFVKAVQAAASAVDPIGAVNDVVASAIVHGAAINSALGTDLKPEHETLFSSDRLTIQRIIWPAGLRSSPHEHRMWAVVGVYAGQELNRLYRRAPDGLAEVGARAVSEREVFVLDSEAIHSVENPAHEWTAGLHVYGGDIVNIERSAWGPDGREVPWSQNAAANRAMWEPMRDLAREHGLRIDDDSRYVAFAALAMFCQREHRHPTASEARNVVAHAWALPDN